MAGHGKVSARFLFHRRCQMANLIDNEIHVTAETIFISKYSVTLARTVISKHNFRDSGKEYSAILARRGNKQKVRHFRRHFDIMY